MHGISNDSKEDRYEEEWKVVLVNKAEYSLSKEGAMWLRESMIRGEKRVMFDSFTIPIAYIVEFFRVRRFLKEEYQLPERASEKPYIPVSPDKWEEIKKKTYEKIRSI